MLCFYYHLPPKIFPFCSKFFGKYMRGNFLFNIVAGCSPATLLKTDSETGVFPRVSRNFQEHILNKSANGYFITFAVLDCEQNWKKGTLVVKQNHRIGVQPYKRFLERTNKFFTRPCKSLYLPASAFFCRSRTNLLIVNLTLISSPECTFRILKGF